MDMIDLQVARWNSLAKGLCFALLGLLLNVGCASVNREAESDLIIPIQERDGVIAKPVSKSGEFVLGPGDEITILVYRQADLTRKIKVLPDGMISYPFVGELAVSGMTLTELRRILTKELNQYFHQPQVAIEMTTLRSPKVTVLGEVKTPGSFVIETPMSVIDAVSVAGGTTIDAKKSSILLLRHTSGSLIVKKVDLEASLQAAEGRYAMGVQSGDVVYVPRSFIADLNRYMQTVSNIISPLVFAEFGIVLGPQMLDALKGNSVGASTAIAPR